MASTVYNVGIIGYGTSAKFFHIPLVEVVPELNLYAIVQRHPTAENDASKDFPDIKRYGAVEDMMEDPLLDIVVVTTPPPTHFELTKLALENGKHVVVEKPFVPTSREANQLIDLAKMHRKLLTVYQNRRWDTDFLTVRDLVKNETLGRIVEFESHFDRYKPSLAGSKAWKTRVEPGGGAIYDLGAHLIDQVYVLFGLPKKITAFLTSQRVENPGGYNDACTVLLHYEGMMATVKVSVLSPEAAQMRFWVRGEKGSYKKLHEDCQETHLIAGMKPGNPGFGIEPEDWHGTLTTIEDGNTLSRVYRTVHPQTYVTFYTQLVQALTGDGEMPVKSEDASAVIRLIELAKQSSDEGRSVDV
ncbi:MAG: hypothetical protein Q9201_005225 [Fulgogasparrea decipioides]